MIGVSYAVIGALWALLLGAAAWWAWEAWRGDE
jgi:hypothetical protein